MRHDSWKSQYIFAILNYQKIGFKRVSDLSILDSTSYHLNLRKIDDQQRWPLAKINIALDPQIILHGVKGIEEFFAENYYFEKPIDKSSPFLESLEKFIDEHVSPHLESIFWHPLLTFQYTFHSSRHSYFSGMKTYIIHGIIYRNGLLLLKRIYQNLKSIFKERERYSQSKQNLTKSLK